MIRAERARDVDAALTMVILATTSARNKDGTEHLFGSRTRPLARRGESGGPAARVQED